MHALLLRHADGLAVWGASLGLLPATQLAPPVWRHGGRAIASSSAR